MSRLGVTPNSHSECRTFAHKKRSGMRPVFVSGGQLNQTSQHERL